MNIVSYCIINSTTKIVFSTGRAYDTEELRTGVPQGYEFVVLTEGAEPPVPDRHQLDASGKFIPLEAAPLIDRSDKSSELRYACSRAILAGFASDALGEKLRYPSEALDQTNMLHAAAVGGKLMTFGPEGWVLRDHTEEQAKTVLKAFVDYRDGLRERLSNRLASVVSASSQDQITEIQW